MRLVRIRINGWRVRKWSESKTMGECFLCNLAGVLRRIFNEKSIGAMASVDL